MLLRPMALMEGYMESQPRPVLENPHPITPGARIGHVHLKVADLDRALAFYSGVLGFELMQRMGTQAAFLSAGGYHHHIGLEYMAEQRRAASCSRNDGSLPYRHRLSFEGRPG